MAIEDVGEKKWTYRRNIRKPAVSHGARIVLCLEGLDTFAVVRLDDHAILESDNMFLAHRTDITEIIKGESVLEIEFESALLQARKIEKAHPEHRWIAYNGEAARCAARKAQYHWGWDWGPKIMCAGIWKPVYLEVFTARINDVSVVVKLADDLRMAKLAITTDVETVDEQPMKCHVIVRQRGLVVKEASVQVLVDGAPFVELSIDKPALWWPNGYGAQELYAVEVTLLSNDLRTTLSSLTKTIGIRSIELVQDQDSIGRSFYFRVNGVPIFCGGACWIPADSILTNLDSGRYHKWVELMAQSHQVMVRVWGGGIYESDAFYNACDQLGILVFQDFMFGCGNYPAYSSFLDSVKQEAIHNVVRLRHHPCLALWSGNNEDYQVAEQQHLDWRPEDTSKENWLKSNFPARYVYEKLLPDICKKLTPYIPYIPGSPWSPDNQPTMDQTRGDLHQWNVWHGTQEKYQSYPELGGRFNSEFGMEAFPHMSTVESMLEKDSKSQLSEKDLQPQSHVLEFHNKAAGASRRIATYMVENVREVPTTNFPAYIHLSQLIQAEALTYGYKNWRRQWGETAEDGKLVRRCGGALCWQLNDCWPTTSWSIVDYYLRPKAAYYAIKRCLAPLAVGIRRETWDWTDSHQREPEKLKWECWISSSRLEEVKIDLEVRFISVRTGQEVKDSIEKSNVTVLPNRTTEVLAGNVERLPDDEKYVIAARIFEEGCFEGNCDGITPIARDIDWPQPLKWMSLGQDRGIKVVFEPGLELGSGRANLLLGTEKPVKGFTLEVKDGESVSDNCIDLVPGDVQVIEIRDRKDPQGEGMRFRYRYLDMPDTDGEWTRK